ncbi:MAG: hypothetical protein MRY78_00975, partial [Saprospiraceae bacterium]|nr:hypothetical protein [Saprospiraceae bacterium]
MRHTIQFFGWCFSLLLISACSQVEESSNTEGPLFRLLNNEDIGIDFSNNLTSTPEFNVYKYRNFYNGGGVALGDINNDGLVDIYMVSNQSP